MNPARPIRVIVRLFAVQRELAGRRTVELELPAGATVEDAWGALTVRFPVLAPGRPFVRFARNAEYVEAASGLADGDELACIPPVSGGDRNDSSSGAEPGGGSATAPNAGTGGERNWILAVLPAPLPIGLAESLGGRLATPADGAVVVFLGRTRSSPGTPAPGQEASAAAYAGKAVLRLEYEAHEAMARGVLAAIAAEIAERFGVERLAIVHAMGLVPVGEPSVVVVAVAPHRDAAFEAARYAIDETKARAPIWKAETFEDGHVWIGQPARLGPPGPAGRATASDRHAGPAASGRSSSRPSAAG